VLQPAPLLLPRRACLKLLPNFDRKPNFHIRTCPRFAPSSGLFRTSNTYIYRNNIRIPRVLFSDTSRLAAWSQGPAGTMDSSRSPEKRQSPDDQTSDQNDRLSKRQRTSTLEPERQRTSTLEPEPVPNAFDVSELGAAIEEVQKPSAGDTARDGLRRSVVLVLQQVGFDSASQEALESLTSTVETCELGCGGRYYACAC
jgi:hypothetical protein